MIVRKNGGGEIAVRKERSRLEVTSSSTKYIVIKPSLLNPKTNNLKAIRVNMTSKNLMQMLTDIVKLDRFDGGSFKRYQKKIQFLLATLKVAYVLTKPYPKESENDTLAASRERPKFENDEFICRGHVLNAMPHQIFDVYQNYSMVRELYNALEERYYTKDATNLGKHLLIEGQYHLENKANDHTSKVHVMVERGESSKTGGKKRKHDDKDKKKSKKNKMDVIYYNCKKVGEYYDPRYFESRGIVHQVTSLYTPQQNGIAKRKNRTLMDMVNSMISYSGLSSGYWGEAFLKACYILNKVPSKRNIKTPYELWRQRTPKLEYLQIWGCRAIVRLPFTRM
uniref:Zinc finger, CCHC-type n=1 Tax=Tanacetum cinerariifolium TaxID=118510 RepID=A0A699IEW7_TANCI|nr:zinc finger, CCHC-type [Tanacetum cinerariifolium]